MGFFFRFRFFLRCALPRCAGERVDERARRERRGLGDGLASAGVRLWSAGQGARLHHTSRLSFCSLCTHLRRKECGSRTARHEVLRDGDFASSLAIVGVLLSNAIGVKDGACLATAVLTLQIPEPVLPSSSCPELVAESEPCPPTPPCHPPSPKQEGTPSSSS